MKDNAYDAAVGEVVWVRTPDCNVGGDEILVTERVVGSDRITITGQPVRYVESFGWTYNMFGKPHSYALAPVTEVVVNGRRRRRVGSSIVKRLQSGLSLDRCKAVRDYI